MTITTDRKETEIGMIPQEWEVWSIWENCDLLTGFPFKWNMYDDKEWIRVLRWENVSLWFIRRDSDKKWKHDQTGLNKYFLQDLDLVVWMDWSRVWRNRAMIKQTDLPLLLAQRVARIRAEWNLDQKFLSYQILHEQFEKFVDKLKTGTSIPHISGDQIKSYPIILPPLNEQQAIATTLWSLDDKIELLREQNKTLESMGQAMFKSWLVDFDGMTEFEDSELGMIPKGWRVGKLGDVWKVICGKTPSKAEPENFWWEIPFIKIPDMHWQIFVISTEDSLSEKWHKTQENKLVPKYSICVSCIATVWLVSINTKASHTNQQINSIIPINENMLYWLYFELLQKYDLLQWIWASWSATLNINTETFRNIEIVIPDTETINGFHSKINEVLWKIEVNLYEIQSLTQTRDNLLPRLMNGKIRVV